MPRVVQGGGQRPSSPRDSSAGGCASWDLLALQGDGSSPTSSGSDDSSARCYLRPPKPARNRVLDDLCQWRRLEVILRGLTPRPQTLRNDLALTLPALDRHALRLGLRWSRHAQAAHQSPGLRRLSVPTSRGPPEVGAGVLRCCERSAMRNSVTGCSRIPTRRFPSCIEMGVDRSAAWVADTVPTVLVSGTERVQQSGFICVGRSRERFLAYALGCAVVRNRDGRGLARQVRNVLVVGVSCQQPILVLASIPDLHDQPRVVATTASGSL